jgi:hypothetical protein
MQMLMLAPVHRVSSPLLHLSGKRPVNGFIVLLVIVHQLLAFDSPKVRSVGVAMAAL